VYIEWEIVFTEVKSKRRERESQKKNEFLGKTVTW